MKSTLLRGLALCGAAAVMCAAAIAPAHASTFTMSFSGPPLVIPVVGSFGGTDLGEFRINPFSADFALSTPDCVGSGPTFICDLTLSAPSASDPAPVTYMSPASAPSGFDSVSPEIVGTVDLSVTHNASGQTTTQAYSYRGNVFENPFSGLYSAQFEFFGTSLSANDMNLFGGSVLILQDLDLVPPIVGIGGTVGPGTLLSSDLEARLRIDVIPEPGTLGLLAVGLVGLGAGRRRLRR